MRRRFTIISGCAVLAAAAVLTACGGSSSAETTAAETTAAETAAAETEAAAAEETQAPETEAAEVLTGEAEGYGGPITAEVTVDADGTIVGLVLTGDAETETIGGAALEPLTEAILAAGTIEGVDGVSGATWTSNGVFAAVRAALGIEEAAEEAGTQAVQAAGLSHGLGVLPSGRLGPGADDQGVGVYEFNEVVAYVLFDDAGTILDLEVDQLEVATPNYDGDHMPDFTGFPGQSYNADTDHDEVVDTVLEQTEETFQAEVASWKTKRYRDGYKLDSGTWKSEMDIFESKFIGMTVEEVEAWYEKYCSDVNGKVLFGTSEDESDVAKYEAFTDEDLAEVDSVSGATMSLNDSHGNILGAIVKAYENRVSVEAEKVAKIGLGFTNFGRLGPGADDQGVGIYSFDTQIAGTCYDEDGAIIALYMDVVEVATPNYDGAHMPDFTGFPGQSYNADEDHDEKVDTVLEQTEETFLEQVASWRTKRERGNEYKLGSGNWGDEADILQAHFAGMTADEAVAWYEKFCSDVNGKILFGTSEDESDISKYEALTDDEKASLDALTGATLSLNDSHGDLIGAIADAWAKAKDTDITVE